MRTKIRYILTVIAILLLQIRYPQAALEINVNDGNLKPLPIAIPSVIDKQGLEKDLGFDISRVIASDLAGSGLFYPINPKAFLENLNSISQNQILIPGG